jgi:hypothetical protein
VPSYPDQLNAIIEQIENHKNSKSSAVLREVINTLERGLISDLLFVLDDQNFRKVIRLLCSFRETGREYEFNTLHATARQRVRCE